MNSDTFSSTTYIADENTPREIVYLPGHSWDASLQAVLNRGVPIPPGSRGARGTDGSYALYKPSTDEYWDFWQLAKNSSGAWTTSWGGYIANFSQNAGNFPKPNTNWGSAATSLPLGPQPITVKEALAGIIPHAIGMAIVHTGNTFVQPAERTDGPQVGGIPEGTRFRFPTSIDFDHMDLFPFERTVAKAIQNYGMILRDTCGVQPVLYAEDPTPYILAAGGDPSNSSSYDGPMNPWNNITSYFKPNGWRYFPHLNWTQIVAIDPSYAPWFECAPKTSCISQGKSCGEIFDGCNTVICGPNKCPPSAPSSSGIVTLNK